MSSQVANDAKRRETSRGLHELTSREREVAALLAEGKSKELIARWLHVAVPTAKNHVGSILDQWGVRNRGEAAVRYRRQIHAKAEKHK